MSDGHASPRRVAEWHGPVCYHPHRSTMWEGPIPGMGNLVLRCDDCGASVRAAYQTPMPDLPPMPTQDGKVLA